MARFIVPMSPKEVNTKTLAIWKHQSQKDGPMGTCKRGKDVKKDSVVVH